MFAHIYRATLFAFFTFVIFAAANTPSSTVTVTVTQTATATAIPATQCSTGNIQCCNSVQSATSKEANIILALLGVVIQGVEALVGLTCSPIDIIGLTSGACTTQAVCCQNNQFNGLIAIGCVPINIVL